jgi:outer membrane protein OmpA-like peptidoglycan-associated protein
MTRWVLLLLCVLLTACHGPREQVILLPGGTAPLTLTTAQGQTLTLDTPYQTAQARPSGRLDAGMTTAADVHTRYGRVLQMLPEPGRLWTLRFDTGATTLEPESAAEVPALLAEVVRRGAVEVLLEGHTDQTGEDEDNEALSLARAEAVRDLLVAQGLTAPFVRVVGRGARAPLVDAPGQAEPQNRRVEVLVR